MASTSAAAAAVGRQIGAASGTGSLGWRDHALIEMAGMRWPAGKRIDVGRKARRAYYVAIRPSTTM